ncbi:hypothetical protein RRG08_060679 [Elysia crispata]|uniref:Uncharacterized protein n=1 Tax=Elysia crispata TaxID=231223 RepID=A0AAE0YRE0_9GAST|nr:hypothetical protein RRG08_060679 [Elysia crispata]
MSYSLSASLRQICDQYKKNGITGFPQAITISSCFLISSGNGDFLNDVWTFTERNGGNTSGMLGKGKVCPRKLILNTGKILMVRYLGKGKVCPRKLILNTGKILMVRYLGKGKVCPRKLILNTGKILMVRYLGKGFLVLYRTTSD